MGIFTAARRRAGWMTGAIAALVLVAVGATACGSSGAASTQSTASSTKSPIVLGVSAPLSGAEAYVGTAILNGLKLGIKQVNAQGGVLGGRKIKLVQADDGCDPGQAVSAAKKLIQDNVPAIFGPGCSGAVLAEMPLIKTAQIPMLVADATNPQITAQAGVGGNEYTWRINANDSLIAQGFSKYIAQHAKSIMFVAENDDYGRGGVAAYKPLFPKLGVKFLGAQYYSPGLGDFRPIIAKIQSSHPQALFLVGEPRDEANLLRQINEQGLKYQIYGRGVTSPDLLQALGKPSLANGIVSGDFWALGLDPKYDAAYQKAYGAAPPVDSPGQYYGAFVMAKAIDLGGGATPQDIQNGLAKVNMTLPWGHVKFDAHHQAHPNVVISTFSNGKVKILDTIKTG